MKGNSTALIAIFGILAIGGVAVATVVMSNKPTTTTTNTANSENHKGLLGWTGDLLDGFHVSVA